MPIVAQTGPRLLAAIAAASVLQRLVLWETGANQYAAAGAPSWLYPGLTLLQAFAGIALLFRSTRAFAAAGIALVPTILLARRALSGELRQTDLLVGLVIVLATVTLLAHLARERD
jgi:hypothetical protein